MSQGSYASPPRDGIYLIEQLQKRFGMINTGSPATPFPVEADRSVCRLCEHSLRASIDPRRARWINIKETRTGLAIERISWA